MLLLLLLLLLPPLLQRRAACKEAWRAAWRAAEGGVLLLLEGASYALEQASPLSRPQARCNPSPNPNPMHRV